MHLSRATQKAVRLARQDKESMAVVHCGCGEYTVKRASLASRHYPCAVRVIVKASGRVSQSHQFNSMA